MKRKEDKRRERESLTEKLTKYYTLSDEISLLYTRESAASAPLGIKFFLPVFRRLNLVLLTFARWGAGWLTPKSGVWTMCGLGNQQTAPPPLSFWPCRAGICSVFQDKEHSPNLPAPPNPLLWTWFKSAQSVSVHCFCGQLESLRNEWKQTVTDQLSCTLSSRQKRSPVGVPS